MRVNTFGDQAMRDEAFFLGNYLNIVYADKKEFLIRRFIENMSSRHPATIYRLSDYFEILRVNPNMVHIYAQPLNDYLVDRFAGYVPLDYVRFTRDSTNFRWDYFIHPELRRYISLFPELPILINIQQFYGQTVAGHANVLFIRRIQDITTTTGYRVVLQRFEPCYKLDERFSLPLDFTGSDEEYLFHTQPSDWLNDGLATSFSGFLSLPVEYQIINSQFRSGPQSAEQSTNEELGGYCLFWSMNMIEIISESFLTNTIQFNPESFVNSLFQNIRDTTGGIEPGHCRMYIQRYCSDYTLSLFQQQLTSTPPIIDRNRVEFIWRYIQRTIPYQDILERFVLSANGRVGIFPSITITKYSSEQSGLTDYEHNLLSGFHYYSRRVGGIINDISQLEKPMVGLLILKEEGWHLSKNIEHINVLVVVPTISYGSDKRLESVTVYRYEPSYSQRTETAAMTNMNESSDWNRILLTNVNASINSSIRRVPGRLNVTYRQPTSLSPIGPQTLEYQIQRERGEHIGYCQTWSFYFIDKFLKEINNPTLEIGMRVTLITPEPGVLPISEGEIINYDGTNMVDVRFPIGVKKIAIEKLRLSASSYIDRIIGRIQNSIFADAGVTVGMPLTEAQNRLYQFIRDRARELANLVVDNYFVPYFRSQMVLSIGTRVRRGPNWQTGNQDDVSSIAQIQVWGTVTNHSQGGLVNVLWDNSNSGFYRWGQQDAFELEINPPFWSSLLSPGTFVRRGPDWVYGNQDHDPSGNPVLGIVVGADDQGFVAVLWENGTTQRYRWGNGSYDLVVISP